MTNDFSALLTRFLPVFALIFAVGLATDATAASELKPTYRSSYSPQAYANRWEAERDIWNAEGWPGSEMAVSLYGEEWSTDALRTLYALKDRWKPKEEYFGPTLWTSELQNGLCNDCPLYDDFGNERCPAGETAMCASESAIGLAIEAHFSNYCDYYVDGETPWYFVDYSGVGPPLADGTQVYGTWFKKLYTVKYWRQPYGCVGPPQYKDWIYDASAYSWTACPTGYYGAISLAPDGTPSCSNHFGAWLYEYNPLEYGGDCPVGNPCYPKTGAKSLSETDFRSPTLELTRSWNSLARYRDYAAMGRGWTHNYSQRILDYASNGPPLKKLLDGEGAVEYFECTDEPGCSLYRSRRSPGWLLKPASGGWEVLSPHGERRLFDARGRLTAIEHRGADYSLIRVSYADGVVDRVTDQSGRSLVFNYNGDGLVDSVTLPDGAAILYDYDRPASIPSHVTWQQRLVRVVRQDLTERRYHYEDRYPDLSSRFEFLVTGITDENNTRYADYAYDEDGRVVSSGHALGAGRITLAYTNRPGETAEWTITQVTRPLGEVVTYGMNDDPFRKLTSLRDSRGTLSISRDPLTTWQTGRTDRNGTLSTYLHADGLHETRRIEAVGTAEERVIETDWDNSVNRVTQQREPGRTTRYTYNGRGQVLVKTETDLQTLANRTWTYSYFEAPSIAELVGRLRTVDGPRTDVADMTSYDYYTVDDPGGAHRKGDLRSVSNALGHLTEYLAYDENGRPLQVLDANGTLTTLAWHPRGWLASRTVDGQTTSFTYDDVGNLTRVVQADGSFTALAYDDAHRLVAMQDNFGNSVAYVLDAAGNRVAEHTYDEDGALRRSIRRAYDSLSRLRSLIDGNLHETRYDYDAHGNLSSARDANLEVSRFEYDALDRLVRSIDAASGETLVSYDGRDNPVSVTDPLGHATDYTYDGFDNRALLNSPDTGITANEYDEAGNRTAATDARGVRVEYGYDALNRLVSVDYAGDSLDVAFAYDAGANGRGRLTAMSDAAGTESYTYDARGNLLGVLRDINGRTYTTGFAYNGADRLTRIAYPTGVVVDYVLDAGGRITAVNATVDGVTENLVSEIGYLPFGPVQAFTFGNGLAMQAEFDQDYELDALRSGADLDWTFGHDPAGNILLIADRVDPARDRGFAYDALHRLTSATGAHGSQSFEYDANGNRLHYLSDTLDDTYTYEPGSGRLAVQGSWTIARDAAGNRLDKLNSSGAGFRYAYGDDNRLATAIQREIRVSGKGRKRREVAVDTVVGAYAYDGRGQRIAKTTGSGETHFVYGPAGELLGEYREDGSAAREYVWLRGQPVAVITHGPLQPEPLEVVVDNDTGDTAQTGNWDLLSSNKDYGPDYRRASGPGNTYRWSPSLPAGTYEVQAWWVSRKNYSDAVEYAISHAGTTDLVTRSHTGGGGKWQMLGTWVFDGQADEFVEVSAANGTTVADAVRFVRAGGSPGATVNTYFIHADHLGTPRAVSDESRATVWRWDSTPFGEGAPNEDPDGDGSNFILHLRFPGQYFDAESGLHYNYFRDYDPANGRYVESDPLGLAGGLNGFSYAENVPVLLSDPRGLKVTGSWIRRPRFNVTDYGVTGGRFITPYLNEWGYLKVFRVHGYASGFVNIDVRCEDSGGCEETDWEIHQRLGVSWSGYKDLGPNTAAAAAGSVAGPLAGAAASIITLGGSSLAALLEILKEAQALGADKLKWLHAIGPTALCLGTQP